MISKIKAQQIADNIVKAQNAFVAIAENSMRIMENEIRTSCNKAKATMSSSYDQMIADINSELRKSGAKIEEERG